MRSHSREKRVLHLFMSAAPTEWISVKFDTGDFYENLSIVALPMQYYLRERATILRYMYIAYIFFNAGLRTAQ